MPQQQNAGHDHSRRINHILARISGGGAVDGFKDGNLVADVGAGGKTQAADEGAGEVADDVAVHVGGDDDVELLGLLYELMSAVIDDHVPRLNVRVFLGHGL